MPSVDEEVDWDFYKCVLPIPEDQFIFSPEMEQIRDTPRVDILYNYYLIYAYEKRNSKICGIGVLPM